MNVRPTFVMLTWLTFIKINKIEAESKKKKPYKTGKECTNWDSKFEGNRNVKISLCTANATSEITVTKKIGWYCLRFICFLRR